MRVELAFFDGDTLLTRGEIQCGVEPNKSCFHSKQGHTFLVNYQFEEPACPVEIECIIDDAVKYRAALRVGVHNSEDWEVISLGNIHDLGFKCSEAM